MKLFQILEHTTKEQNIGRINWVYSHGKLENDCKYDIFYIKSPIDYGFSLINDSKIIKLNESNIGITPCYYNNKKCSMFIWCVDGYKEYTGLVVYNDDKKSYEYALKCYNNKEQYI